MHNRSSSYLDENKLLFKNQFGFRHGHSTEHARFELIEQISESLNSNNYFSGILKAFDTVDHQIFKKLHFYGIREKTLKWFSSYVSNRKQCIENMIEEVKKNSFFIHYMWSSARFDFVSFAFYHIYQRLALCLK